MIARSLAVECPRTARRLTDDSLMTAWWRPDDGLMTAWWRPDDGLMTAWWRPDDSMMTVWWLHYDKIFGLNFNYFFFFFTVWRNNQWYVVGNVFHCSSRPCWILHQHCLCQITWPNHAELFQNASNCYGWNFPNLFLQKLSKYSWIFGNLTGSECSNNERSPRQNGKTISQMDKKHWFWRNAKNLNKNFWPDLTQKFWV